jgi:hypothetical protein
MNESNLVNKKIFKRMGPSRFSPLPIRNREGELWSEHAINRERVKKKALYGIASAVNTILSHNGTINYLISSPHSKHGYVRTSSCSSLDLAKNKQYIYLGPVRYIYVIAVLTMKVKELVMNTSTDLIHWTHSSCGTLMTNRKEKWKRNLQNCRRINWHSLGNGRQMWKLSTFNL